MSCVFQAGSFGTGSQAKIVQVPCSVQHGIDSEDTESTLFVACYSFKGLGPQKGIMKPMLFLVPCSSQWFHRRLATMPMQPRNCLFSGMFMSHVMWLWRIQMAGEDKDHVAETGLPPTCCKDHKALFKMNLPAILKHIYIHIYIYEFPCSVMGPLGAIPLAICTKRSAWPQKDNFPLSFPLLFLLESKTLLPLSYSLSSLSCHLLYSSLLFFPLLSPSFPLLFSSFSLPFLFLFSSFSLPFLFLSSSFPFLVLFCPLPCPSLFLFLSSSFSPFPFFLFFLFFFFLFSASLFPFLFSLFSPFSRAKAAQLVHTRTGKLLGLC